MKKFSEYTTHKDMELVLTEMQDERIDELLGGLGAAASAGVNQLGGMWNGIKKGMQNIGNAYQQGQKNSEIQKVSGMVNNLRNGLKTVGFTDPRVHGVLNNIDNVLKTGLGNNMKVGSQSVNFKSSQNNSPNFNSRIQQARNMYQQQQLQKPSGDPHAQYRPGFNRPTQQGTPQGGEKLNQSGRPIQFRPSMPGPNS